ncbi:hypothetical protein TWF718_002426 [Orbilia javanica]|uniref:Uncharacterized protein n=1 Tax=Orbilia javanica TaxID=47235 RepID=A0AAN8MQI5_9PEZI
MGFGNVPGSSNQSEGYGFQHELDDYINSFVEEDQFSLFFNDTYFDGFGEIAGLPPSVPNEFIHPFFDVPDSAIDPQLRAAVDLPAENSHAPLSTPSTNIIASPGLLHPSPTDINVHTLPQAPTICSPPRKLRRRSKKEESTHNHNSEAKYPLYDRRLYELAKHQSRSGSSLPGLLARNNSTLDTRSLNEGSTPSEISQTAIDEFLASLDPSSLDHDIGDIIMTDLPDPIPPQIQQTAAQSSVGVLTQQDYTLRMLSLSAPLVQPSEKRKRGRPKKDEVDESHQEVAPFPIPQNSSYHQGQIQPLLLPTSFPGQSNVSGPYLNQPQPILPANFALTPPSQASFQFTPNPGSEADDERSTAVAKRRRTETRNSHRSMSKKEQAYLEMDDKVKLYDHTNINELLYCPSVKPGRTPCFWIQRHPYANTRVYEDHYRTWCRYRHCKGVETAELIRTASGEMREKNYKHPRTIIAGNYQVAVDWEYVVDEIAAFKNDPEGQYAYDRRNVFDTIECFFHLRCFEQLVDFPHVARTQLVQIDHRVLHQDKSRNNITKRKNKGGTNAAEIEWYLKDDAEDWMKRAQLDWSFNPPPGSDESLEKVLLNGKKQYNEKKGSKYMFQSGSEFGSPAPSEL